MTKMDPLEAAEIIERFVDGKGNPWEWGDFITSHFKAPVVEGARKICDCMQETHPAGDPHVYCNTEGLQVLLRLAQALRESQSLGDVGRGG